MPELLAGRVDDIVDLCQAVEQTSGWPATIVEKDLWVTWALGVLFDSGKQLLSEQGHPVRLAFKGGTSLSKAYGVITRFSEDVDITMHFGDLGVLKEPLSDLSRNAAQKAREALTRQASVLVRDQVVPLLRARMEELEPQGLWSIDVDDDNALNVRLHYPHAFADTDPYLREDVLLEFGGRNVAVPANSMNLTAMAHSHFPNVGTPLANNVQVLAGEYTFWEKVTLAHAELKRATFASRVERMSRHWSDLRALSLHHLGASALNQTNLRDRVIEVKSAMFPAASGIDYRDVARGQCEITPPEGASLEALRSDYQSMLGSGMLGKEAPTWEDVQNSVRHLQDRINSSAG